MQRRKFLFSLSAIPVISVFGKIEKSLNIINKNRSVKMLKFELPQLTYGYDALEPYIDKMTMEIHYSKHHQTYTNNLNKALEPIAADVKGKTIEDILGNISKYPIAVKNNAGGYYNHSMFWSILKKNNGQLPSGEIGKEINSSFGSFEEFKEKFNAAAIGRFGSGWAWLITNNSKLEIISTANQDNPLMDIAEKKGFPILVLDVWEHAYYLKYQNRRNEYVENWWNVVNWQAVDERLKQSK